MIYLSKAEVHVLFIPALPLKVKFVAKFFLKDKLLSPLFNSVKFSLRPKNEWIALVALKLSVGIRVSQIGSTCQGDNLGKMAKTCMKHPPVPPLTMGNPGRYILKKGSHDLSTSLIRKVFLSKSSLKHNLSTDSLTGAISCS